MKKIVSALTGFILLFTATYAAGFFTDVDEATEEGQAIVKMAERGIVSGVGNGLFKPDDSLTRAEFVKMVNNVFGYTQIGSGVFSDVPAGKWFYNDVCIAYEAGYISGVGNGLFAPEMTLSREMVCVIMNNILKMEQISYFTAPADKVSEWARASVEKALSNGLVSLDENGKFRAGEAMTRGEVCLVLSKCLVDVGPIGSISLETIAKEELTMRMERVIDSMRNQVIPSIENEKAVVVSQMIIDNMSAYLADNSHDYIKASQATFEIYKTIPKEERETFKAVVQKYNKLEDLMLLYDFFFVI